MLPILLLTSVCLACEQTLVLGYASRPLPPPPQFLHAQLEAEDAGRAGGKEVSKLKEDELRHYFHADHVLTISDVDKASKSCVNYLILTGESILSEERLGWMATSKRPTGTGGDAKQEQGQEPRNSGGGGGSGGSSGGGGGGNGAT